MKVDIYIEEKSGNRSIQIPWLPESITCESGGTIRATYDIMDRGPVEVQTGSGLCTYSWGSQFPGENRTIDELMHGDWKPPSYYHNILEDWKNKKTKLHLIVIGYPINKDVILSEYKGVAGGGFGDIEYEVEFIEDRNITIQSTTVVVEQKTEPQRPTTPTTSYTVKRGDNLWNIAASKLGKGSRNKEIYELNKDIIESTAKKYGYKSSNNGWWIFPGTVLKIPAK